MHAYMHARMHRSSGKLPMLPHFPQVGLAPPNLHMLISAN